MISIIKKAKAIPKIKKIKGLISSKKLVATPPKPPNTSVELENNIIFNRQKN